MASCHSPHNSCHHVCMFMPCAKIATSCKPSYCTPLPYPPSLESKKFTTIFQMPFQNLHLMYHYLCSFSYIYPLKSSLAKGSLEVIFLFIYSYWSTFHNFFKYPSKISTSFYHIIFPFSHIPLKSSFSKWLLKFKLKNIFNS
jgi:hypothetical protein